MLKTLGGYFLIFSSFIWAHETLNLADSDHPAQYLTALLTVVTIATGIAITSED